MLRKNKMTCPVCYDQAVRWTVQTTHAHCLSCLHDFQVEIDNIIKYDNKYVLESYDAYHTTRMTSLLRASYVISTYTLILGAEPSSLLDFGYGNGDFLKTVRLSGCDIYGYDVHGSDYGVPRISLNDIKNKSFDVITMFDVLEHLPDFDIVNHLNCNMLFITIPEKPGFFGGVSHGISYEKNIYNWKHFKPNEHLHHFSFNSIKRLFHRRYKLVNTAHVEDLIRGKVKINDKIKDNTITLMFVKNDI